MMKKRTLQTLQEMAEIHRALKTYQVQLKRVSRRYPDLYVSVPPSCLEGLQQACFGLQDFARHIAKLENLPLSAADLSHYRSAKNSTINP